MMPQPSQDSPPASLSPSTAHPPGQQAALALPRASWASRHPWAPVALLVVLFALHAWGYKALADFDVFHRAGARLLAGDLLYQLADGRMPFKYAPVVAVLFAPFALLPPALAKAAWLLLTSLLTVRFLRLCAERFGGSSSWGAHLAVLFFMLPFLRSMQALGQCDIVLLWLAAESEREAERRPWLSGMTWALACLFKPPFLLFLLPLALARQGRRLLWMPVGLGLGLLLPALRYGWEGNLHQHTQWRAMLSGSTPELLCARDNQSLFSIVCRYLLPPEAGPSYLLATVAAAAVIVGVLGLAVFLLWRRNPAEAHTLALASAFYLTALLSPLGWRANLLGLVPALYLLLRLPGVRRPAGALRWALALPALSAVSGLFVYDLLGPDAARALMDLRHFGLVSLAIMLVTAGAAAVLLRTPRSA